MNFFNTGLIFTLEVFILCRKVYQEGLETREFQYTFLLIYSNQLSYLQLIAVLVYKSSPFLNETHLDAVRGLI